MRIAATFSLSVHGRYLIDLKIPVGYMTVVYCSIVQRERERERELHTAADHR